MKKNKTRKKILTAATRVFNKKGYHAAKMDEIAVSAGVAKGTLYYNFPSKSELFSSTVTEGLSDIQDEILEILESDLPFADHFHLLIETLITLYLSHSELINIAFNELSSGIDRNVVDKIKAQQNRFHTFVSDILKKGQSLGYLKALDTDLSARAVIGIVDTVCAAETSSGRPDSKKIIETIYSILSTGLLQP